MMGSMPATFSDNSPTQPYGGELLYLGRTGRMRRQAQSDPPKVRLGIWTDPNRSSEGGGGARSNSALNGWTATACTIRGFVARKTAPYHIGRTTTGVASILIERHKTPGISVLYTTQCALTFGLPIIADMTDDREDLALAGKR